MRLLLLDTCGETGSVALAENGAVLLERSLPARAASSQLVQAVREELEKLRWPLRSLDALGVVNGPGSFTGVRVGLAAAKGLCEVTGLRLVTVSRLAVLLSIGKEVDSNLAVLDAGRGEFFVRAADGEEHLLGRERLLDWIGKEWACDVCAGNRHVLIAEDKLLETLEPLQPRLVKLSAAQSLALAEKKLCELDADTVETADANYVRNERTLYAAKRTTPPEERA